MNESSSSPSVSISFRQTSQQLEDRSLTWKSAPVFLAALTWPAGWDDVNLSDDVLLTLLAAHVRLGAEIFRFLDVCPLWLIFR